MSSYASCSNKLSSKKSHIIIKFLISLYGSRIPKNHTPFQHNTCPTRITCIKCKQASPWGKSKAFKNTLSATKHLIRNHSSKEERANKSNVSPTFFEIFLVYEKIAVCLEKAIPISTILEVRRWGIEVK